MTTYRIIVEPDVTKGLSEATAKLITDRYVGTFFDGVYGDNTVELDGMTMLEAGIRGRIQNIGVALLDDLNDIEAEYNDRFDYQVDCGLLDNKSDADDNNIVGTWQVDASIVKLIPGRYHGPPESCYPDEWVDVGRSVTFHCRVERED